MPQFTAKKYRERAEELHAMAKIFSNAEHKRAMLALATHYDQLARTVERAFYFERANAVRYRRAMRAASDGG